MLDPATLTILSRRPWKTDTFRGELVVVESPADLDQAALDALGTFDGLLVADTALLSQRRAQLMLVEAK